MKGPKPEGAMLGDEFKPESCMADYESAYAGKVCAIIFRVCKCMDVCFIFRKRLIKMLFAWA